LRALFSRKALSTASLLAASAAEARTANSGRGARRADARPPTGWHLAAAKDGAWRSRREPGAAILLVHLLLLYGSLKILRVKVGGRDKMTLRSNRPAAEVLDGANICLTRQKSCTVQQEAPWCLQSSRTSPQLSNNSVEVVAVVSAVLFHNSHVFCVWQNDKRKSASQTRYTTDIKPRHELTN
jgi:hypothetical protein